MKKVIPTFIAVILLLGVSFTWSTCTMNTFNKTKASVLQEDRGDAEKYYSNYCASCHGKQVKAFVDREKWVYGSTRSEMFDVVKHGVEADGMPAYGEVLSDTQVYELVDYILAAIEDKKSADFNSGANEKSAA